MKKFMTLVCMIACIFGLTACGSGEELTEYEQSKVEYAQSIAVDAIVPVLEKFMGEEFVGYCDGLTMEEVAYYVYNDFGLNVDGYGFSTAVESFHSGAAAVGQVKETGAVSAVIDGTKIIVEVELKGTAKDATAEIILSNDVFMCLESAALNPVSSMGELMGRAALNTVIGMGTVFIVLILISAIISCFGIVTKVQNASAAKKAQGQAADALPEREELPAGEQTADESDDTELIAVIAAAIAASQGAATPDGFVVRSVIRRR